MRFSKDGKGLATIVLELKSSKISNQPQFDSFLMRGYSHMLPPFLPLQPSWLQWTPTLICDDFLPLFAALNIETICRRTPNRSGFGYTLDCQIAVSYNNVYKHEANIRPDSDRIPTIPQYMIFNQKSYIIDFFIRYNGLDSSPKSSQNESPMHTWP